MNTPYFVEQIFWGAVMGSLILVVPNNIVKPAKKEMRVQKIRRKK